MFQTPITACIAALDEEPSIDARLEALSICDEILVLAAQPTARTREIAAARGARLIERGWPASQARNDWILSLDAGEYPSPSLSAEILRVRQYGLGGFAGYEIAARAAAASREPRLRLFDRRRCGVRGPATCARMVAYGPVGRLRHEIVAALSPWPRAPAAHADFAARPPRSTTPAGPPETSR